MLKLVKALHLAVFLHGWKNRPVPRLLRQLLAKSSLHRAWIAGWLGVVKEEGQQVCYRTGHNVPEIHDDKMLDLSIEG